MRDSADHRARDRAQTLEILREHLFNWKIWPDFTQIPERADAVPALREIRAGRDRCELDGRSITPLPANHVVPAVGFHLDSGDASLVFTGDTTTNDALWEEVNQIENLRYLIIETAFSNAERELAIALQAPVPEHAGRGAGQAQAHGARSTSRT